MIQSSNFAHSHCDLRISLCLLNIMFFCQVRLPRSRWSWIKDWKTNVWDVYDLPISALTDIRQSRSPNWMNRKAPFLRATPHSRRIRGSASASKRTSAPNRTYASDRRRGPTTHPHPSIILIYVSYGAGRRLAMHMEITSKDEFWIFHPSETMVENFEYVEKQFNISMQNASENFDLWFRLNVLYLSK